MEQEQLETFLVVAEQLAVKGLSEENLDTNAKTRDKKRSNDKRVEGTAKEREKANARDERQGQGGKPQEQAKRDLKTAAIQQDQICNKEVDDQQLENGESGLNNDSRSRDPDNASGDISKTLKKEVHGYSCNLCGKQCSDLSKAKSHIEARHFPSSTGYTCNCCHQWFKTKNALSIHISREHRNKIKHV